MIKCSVARHSLKTIKCSVQLKYFSCGEELVIERVVEVVVHAKQQIRIVMQTVSVGDIPAMK